MVGFEIVVVVAPAPWLICNVPPLMMPLLLPKEAPEASAVDWSTPPLTMVDPP